MKRSDEPTTVSIRIKPNDDPLPEFGLPKKYRTRGPRYKVNEIPPPHLVCKGDDLLRVCGINGSH